MSAGLAATALGTFHCWTNNFDLQCHGSFFVGGLIGFLIIEAIILRIRDWFRTLKRPESIPIEAAYALECVFSITLEYDREDLNKIGDSYHIPKEDQLQFLRDLLAQYKMLERQSSSMAFKLILALAFVLPRTPLASGCAHVCGASATPIVSTMSQFLLCMLGCIIASGVPNIRMGGVTRKRLR
eukprot:m.83603 g.83603  ORF g.83603 m.83603 type:complete len:184 (+) comp8695_c0_seq2:27-578(+)